MKAPTGAIKTRPCPVCGLPAGGDGWRTDATGTTRVLYPCGCEVKS